MSSRSRSLIIFLIFNDDDDEMTAVLLEKLADATAGESALFLLCCSSHGQV